MARKKTHQQNEFGLSFNGMIVVAIRNSDTVIKSEFCNRAASIKDIYTFIKAHISPFSKMSSTQWNKCERVIRHSLSQTTYFHRYQVDQDGSAKIIPSKSAGAEKGGLWTMFPAPGEDKAKAEQRIAKVFKEEHVETFKKHLFNPEIAENLLDGSHGWVGPNGAPLAPSDAKEKLEKQLEEADCEAYASLPTCTMTPGAPLPTRKAGKRRQRKAKDDSDDEEESEDEDEDYDAPIPQRTYSMRKRKARFAVPEPEQCEIVVAPPKKMKIKEEPEEEAESVPSHLTPEDEVLFKYYGIPPPMYLEFPELPPFDPFDDRLLNF